MDAATFKHLTAWVRDNLSDHPEETGPLVDYMVGYFNEQEPEDREYYMSQSWWRMAEDCGVLLVDRERIVDSVECREERRNA